MLSDFIIAFRKAMWQSMLVYFAVLLLELTGKPLNIYVEWSKTLAWVLVEHD